MKKQLNFGFTSQGYQTPYAESVAVAQESILCSSPSDIDGSPEDFYDGDGYWDSPSEGLWDGLGGGFLGTTTADGAS